MPLSIWLRDFAVASAAGLSIVGISALLTKWFKPFQKLSQTIKGYLGPLSHEEIFFLAAFSAIGEEFLFRGCIQAEFGLVFTSILFGVVHFIPERRFIPWTGFAIVVGFIIGWIYQYTGNLWAPILTHFLVNLINGYILVHKTKEPS